MTAWRYKISLLVLKIFHSFAALTHKNIFQHLKRNFVSPSGHVMFYLLYKYQWNTKPFHWNSFFPAKGAIYYVAIATVTFSWRYHVFAQKLTWYFIGGVYMKITLMHQTRKWKLYLPVDGGVTEDTEARKWINR